MPRSPLLRLLLAALGGAIFGRAISLIPSPEAQAVFWVANLSSPWLVLSFLAGAIQQSFRWAAAAGIVADVSCVLGFYAGFLSLDPQRFDLPRSAPMLLVALASLGNWLSFIAPWVAIAIGAGLLYGLAGRWWSRSRSLLPAAIVATPFIVEPFLWRLRNGTFEEPLILWIVEGCVGLGVLLVMSRLTRRLV